MVDQRREEVMLQARREGLDPAEPVGRGEQFRGDLAEQGVGPGHRRQGLGRVAALTQSTGADPAARRSTSRRSGSIAGWMTIFMAPPGARGSVPPEAEGWAIASIKVATTRSAPSVGKGAGRAGRRRPGRAGGRGAARGTRGSTRGSPRPSGARPDRAPGARRSRTGADRSAGPALPSPRKPCRTRPWRRSRRPTPPGRRRSIRWAGTTWRFGQTPAGAGESRRSGPVELGPAAPSPGRPARTARRRSRRPCRRLCSPSDSRSSTRRSTPGVTTIPTSRIGAIPLNRSAGSARNTAEACLYAAWTARTVRGPRRCRPAGRKEHKSRPR